MGKLKHRNGLLFDLALTVQGGLLSQFEEYREPQTAMSAINLMSSGSGSALAKFLAKLGPYGIQSFKTTDS